MSQPVIPIEPRQRPRAPPLEGGGLARSGGRSSGVWSTYRRVESSRHDGSVTRIEFSPAEPHEAAVTAGSAVSLLHAPSSTVRRRLSRFKNVARGGSYKGDGRLLVAGGDSGVVQVFDLASRAILRTFKGHEGAVHSTRFSTDGLRVLSGGDDGAVKVWDVPTSRLLTTLSDATDYVRCQSPSPSSPHLWAVGSYDRHLRVYDLRTRGAPIFDIDHGAQVDDVHLLPGGGLALSVGGPDARVWNLLGGGAVAATLRSHAKAVTCAAVRPDGRIFTGGLDAAVKVHDVATWEVMHTYFYSAQVLSVGVPADDSRIGVGLVDGTAVVRHKDRAAAATAAKAARTAAVGARAGRRQKPTLGVTGMESDSDDASGEEAEAPLGDLTGLPNFLGPTKSPFKQTAFEGWGRAGVAAPSARARAISARSGHKVYAKGSAASAADTDARITKGSGHVSLRLQPWDFAMRRFDWRQALDEVLDGGAVAAAVAVLEQLSLLGKLVDAVNDRSEAELAPLVSLLCRLLPVPELGVLMVEVAHVVLDVYGEKLGATALNALKKAVQNEVRVLGHVEQCLGMCQVVLGRP